MIAPARPKPLVYVVDVDRSGYAFADDPRSGVTTRFFDGAAAALRCRADTPPALWLINQELPEMSGTDLLELLGRRSRCPVGIVTRDYDPQAEIAARTAGATFYLAKPVSDMFLPRPVAA